MRLTPTPLALLCLLVSCASADLDSFAQKNTAREERAFAENYLHLLSGARLDSAAALLAPDLRTDTVAHGLKAVRALLRDARLDSLRLIGVNVFTNAGTQSREVNLSYEVVTTRGRWLSTNVATRSFRGDTSVIGFSAHILPGRLEELHAFTMVGKSLVHYVWLALAVLMPLVTITMAIRVIRAKGMPRRWLWAVAALMASPAFTLNWTTGQGVLANNLFVLFGGSAMQPGRAAPWMLTFAVPIGAFVAYLRLMAWRSAPPSPLSLQSPAPDGELKL